MCDNFKRISKPLLAFSPACAERCPELVSYSRAPSAFRGRTILSYEPSGDDGGKPARDRSIFIGRGALDHRFNGNRGRTDQWLPFIYSYLTRHIR